MKKKHYKIYLKKDKKGKERTICEPVDKIKKIQKRLQILISRIELPYYLFSGKKGFCYVDNAKFHINANNLINIDIKSFYPNCKREYIFKLFRYKYLMCEDVAWFLTDLVVYNDYLPTGSPTSQIVAFWAYKDMFDKMNKYAHTNGLIFSVFVDDITFSSDKSISKTLSYQIGKELKRNGHSMKEEKTKFFSKKRYKIVTGCMISPDNDLKVPNRLRKKIVDDLNAYNINASLQLKKSILGKIQAAQQIEPNLFISTKQKIMNNC
ncbi:reverse transcriptase family protein [bacterium]|nr:reverse transcriptase family protein [bacterium]